MLREELPEEDAPAPEDDMIPICAMIEGVPTAVEGYRSWQRTGRNNSAR
jgi:hypothetical protein